MKLRTPKVFPSTARSRAGEDNEKFQNPTRALSLLLPPAATFRCAGTPLHSERSVVRTYRCNRRVTVGMTAFASRCFPTMIKIPTRLRDRPLEASPGGRRISTRLAHVLHKSGVRVFGDLHGRRVGDFAWERNCGLLTLQELDSLASAFANESSSRNRGTTASRGATAATRQKGIRFVIPESVCQLRFDDLPITKRLANVVRSAGLRTLGNLRGRSPFELLQWKSCGWRTLAEIQQLIERAISGEFDVARIDESTAVAELLTLLEQGIAKLTPRDRQFLLARIGGKTFTEIGWRYGFTRAHVHKVVTNTLGVLRKTWGLRMQRLLEVVERRCLSIPDGSGLTTALLECWIAASTKSFRLSRTAQVRLITTLDKSIPFWMD
jgi:hypothetical protein